MSKKVIYIIGSLKNEKIPHIAREIRELGFEVFDDWFSPGPEADDFWRKYEKVRGSTYKQALSNWAGKHVFEFDKHHIDRADIGILIMPGGKSAHLELGYMIGQGNDMYYPQYTEQWTEESEPTQREEELYRKKIEKHKGRGVCCSNQKEMQDFLANPPTLKEAYKQVWKWLNEQGITEKDEKFLVKLWW